MSRSLYKGAYVDPSVTKKVEAAQDKVIKIWSRASTIVPEFIGLRFAVHNGKVFVPLIVTENMIGHKFGEFAPTRTFKGHTSGDKKSTDSSKKGK